MIPKQSISAKTDGPTLDSANHHLGNPVSNDPMKNKKESSETLAETSCHIPKLSSSVSIQPSPQDPIVFIFYDAGTTKALEPVMIHLDKRDIRYCIIAFGTAKTLLDKHPHYLDANKNLGVKAIVDRQSWPREQPLDEVDAELLKRTISCQLAVVGTSAILEAQLAKKLQSKGIKVLAYYDGFHVPTLNPTLYKAFLQSVDEIIVPSQSVSASFHQLKSSAKILVLGQPILDVWAQFQKRHNIAALRQKLSLLPQQAMLLYAGGYSDNPNDGYEESFRLFIESTKRIKQYKIFIALHPKVNGDTERKIIKEMAIEDLQFLPSDVSTMEGSMISNVIVSQCSTVGVQARFIGRPAIYLDTQRMKYTNIIIEKKLAVQVDNVNDFLHALAEAANEKNFIPIDQLYKRAGVPLNATDNILEHLTQSLLEMQKTEADVQPVANQTKPNSSGLSSLNPASTPVHHKKPGTDAIAATSPNSHWLPLYQGKASLISSSSSAKTGSYHPSSPSAS